MTGQYLGVSATHTDGEGSGKTAHATAANAVTSMPVDTCMEFLAGGPMGPVTQIGAWASDCASKARSGSYAGYYTFELDRRKQVEINLTSAADLYLVRRQGKGRAEGSAEPREPELRDHCDPGGWDLHPQGYDLPRTDRRLHAVGTAAGMLGGPEGAEGRGREERGGTGPGSSGDRAPGLKLLLTSPSSPPHSLVQTLKPISVNEEALQSPPTRCGPIPAGL